MSYSYDDIYPMYAWRDNRRRLVLTQGEGYSGTLSGTYMVKAPRFQLMDEQGIIEIPSSGSPRIQLAVTRPNRTEDLLSCNIEDREQGIISCPITKSMTDIAGEVKGEIRLILDNTVIKFYGIDFFVYDGVSDEAAAQSSQFSDLILALQQVSAIITGGSSGTISLDTVIQHNGTNPVASGILYDYLHGNFVKYATIDSSTLNNTNTHLDPQTIYRYGSQGIIIAANDSDEEAQYYFAQDGKLRYRYRQKTNDEWEEWDTQFAVIETTANKTNSITNNSTDTQYPTAKSVYDSVTLFKNAVPNSTTNVPDNSVKLNDAIDPKYVYRYVSGGITQGLIIPAVTSTQQSQYYFAQDGKLRYRYRQKVNGEWEDWEENDRFRFMINQDNLGNYLCGLLNAFISPQNKADKYFVKTCIDKTQVKLTPKTRILGFGDSIMSQSYGGSWMDVVKDRVGCYAPVNKAIGGAQYANNGNNTLSNQLSSFHTAVNNNTLTDVDSNAVNISEINLIVVAGGTNDAYNGTPINSFKTAVSSFFSSLKSEFTNRSLVCPPVLVITPIRRGKESAINEPIENNLEVKIARYSAVINNLALQSGFSVLNGFDIPVLVDDMVIKGASSETATISSFMYKTADSGDAYDDILHVHPNPTTGRSTYAQAVIDAIGFTVPYDASVFSYTLSRNSWSNNQQSISVPSNYVVTGDIMADTEIGDTAYNQLCADGCAGIYIASVTNGSTLTLTAHALGNVPTADIDIQVTLTAITNLDD